MSDKSPPPSPQEITPGPWEEAAFKAWLEHCERLESNDCKPTSKADFYAGYKSAFNVSQETGLSQGKVTMKEVIGNCELHLADFRHFQEWPGQYVVVTDPPYGIAKTNGGSINTPKAKGDYAGYDDSRENLIGLIKPLMNLVHAGIRAAITPGRTNMWLYDNAVDVGCYYQPAATSMSYWGRATWQPILFYGRDPYLGKKIQPLHYQLTETPSCQEHPCSKPQKGWDWLVERTAKLTDLVIDPFMGSGTTGISCVKSGRKFIGVEIDPRYFDLACKRIEQATRQADMFLEATA